jgi:hypothetical protein
MSYVELYVIYLVGDISYFEIRIFIYREKNQSFLNFFLPNGIENIIANALDDDKS